MNLWRFFGFFYTTWDNLLTRHILQPLNKKEIKPVKVQTVVMKKEHEKSPAQLLLKAHNPFWINRIALKGLVWAVRTTFFFVGLQEHQSPNI